MFPKAVLHTLVSKQLKGFTLWLKPPYSFSNVQSVKWVNMGFERLVLISIFLDWAHPCKYMFVLCFQIWPFSIPTYSSSLFFWHFVSLLSGWKIFKGYSSVSAMLYYLIIIRLYNVNYSCLQCSTYSQNSTVLCTCSHIFTALTLCVS